MQIKGCCEQTIKNCLSPSLHILVTIQILIGLIVIITSEYFKNLLGRYLPEIEQNEINMKLFLFELFGFNVFLSYIGGLPLIRRLSDSFTNHLSSLLKLWNFFIFTASLNGIFGSYMINGSRKFLKKTVETTLFRGLESYYSDPEWRLIWDGFQYNEQCCGVIDFKDWQSLSWIINEDESAKIESEENLMSLTPYSCCKKYSGCYGNVVRQKVSETWIELPLSMNMTLINEKGCLEIFSKQLDKLCVIIFIVVGIVFFVQILILTLMLVLMYKRCSTTIRTLNNQSQTELPKGTPIVLNGSDSVEIVDELNQEDDDGITLHKKTSKRFIVKNYGRRNHVTFPNLSDDDGHETSKLLSNTVN